jgi:hypothetical protein
MKKHILFFCFLLSYFLFNNVNAQINYQWVKGIGSPVTDHGNSIAVDGSGNVYVTGRFGYGVTPPTNFNPYGIPGPITLSNTAVSCFLAKYDAGGNCIWAKKLGSNIVSSGTGVAVDGSGNVYVTGIFLGKLGFDLGDTITSAGNFDGFFAKYDANGVFKWGKHLGGPGLDGVASIAVGTGGVYITGAFQAGASLDTTALANAGSEDVFFAKYSFLGTYIWSKTVGGTDIDLGLGVAVDGADNVYFTGSFQDTVNFHTSLGDTLISVGDADIFFTKYDPSGACQWAKSIGSISTDVGNAITVDASGNVYITGSFEGSADFDPSTSSKTIAPAGLKEIFFAKYDNSGGYKWAENIQSSSSFPNDTSSGAGIAVDLSGNVYITGYFSGTVDFNHWAVNVPITSAGITDAFFAEYDSTHTYVWAKSLGNSGVDQGLGIAVNSSKNVYVTGFYKGVTDFDPGVGTADRTSNGAEDIFIAKYGQGTSTIMGHVNYNNYFLPYTGTNYVKLYTQILNDGNAAMHLADSVSINNSSGDYVFNNVPVGSYRLLATASVDYPLVVPTYNGDSIHWQQAPLVNTISNGSDTVNINMKEIDSLNGNATLSGTLLAQDDFNRTVTPISSTPVGLEHDPEGIIIAHTTTNTSGYYEFDHVPLGCYRIYINIPGLPMDSTYHRCPTALDSVITHLDFVADSSSIDTVLTIVNAVPQLASSKMQVQVYPNPHNGITTIEFAMTEANSVQLEVYNLLGEKVAVLLSGQKQAGIIKYRFNAADAGLKAGVYVLKLKVGNDIGFKKITQVE